MADIKAIIHVSELTFIARCVLDFENLETGGDFFGYWGKDGTPVIKYVTGPGKNTTRTSASFYQDIPYLHDCGDYLHSKFALEHIGSWHSHHKLSLDHPSGGDVNTMRNFLNANEDSNFFISICNFLRSDEVSINGFLFSNKFSNYYRDSDWVVLQEESPYRRHMEDKAKFITYPKTKRAKFKIRQTELYPSKKNVVPEKVELPVNSYFDTEDGRNFLKKEFEKLKEVKQFSEVELVQNEDKTIGITFKCEGKEIEVRYPLDFSEKNPNPILIEKESEKEIKLHIIEIEPTRMYFISPFDLTVLISSMIFGIMHQSSGETESVVINIPIE